MFPAISIENSTQRVYGEASSDRAPEISFLILSPLKLHNVHLYLLDPPEDVSNLKAIPPDELVPRQLKPLQEEDNQVSSE